MRILLTGAAGFIGGHLSRHLLKQGHSVIGVDNLVTGNLRNISDLRHNNRFTFHKKDVSDPFSIPGRIDCVAHFASPASPVAYGKHPVETLRVGSRGTFNCLDIAIKKKAVFMIASTSEVYGDPLVNPQPEEYWGNVSSVGPRSCYDEAKRFSEALAMTYHREFGLQVRIPRIFNTYGPNMDIDDGRAVPNFIKQALSGAPITVYGDGSQTRSLCYVSDLVDALCRLMTGGDCSPVNLGNPQEISLEDLAIAVKFLTKSKSEIVRRPLPEHDPKLRCPDISKAMRLLNWTPAVGLEAGLLSTISYFRGERARRKNGRR